MKAVLISIRPRWCKLIAGGKKTVEVRKSKPKLETPFKVYIYCTQEKQRYFPWSGKVIGEFVCDRIYQYASDLFRSTPVEGTDISTEEMAKLSCLTAKELYEYEHSAEPRENCIYLVGVYGWHISNLKIYDKPKELNDFTPHCRYMTDDMRSCDHRKIACNHQEFDYNPWPDCSLNTVVCKRRMQKPPQSWCYVEEI